MKVRKADSAADPCYPDAKEYLRSCGVLSAAMVGAGMALVGCDQPRGRTGGVPLRTGGVIAAPTGGAGEKPATCPPKTTGKSTQSTSSEKPRLPGKVAGDSKIDPPARLLGDVMVEPRPDPRKPETPPALGGVPPMVPSGDGR